jgi:hypothetical protein
MKLRELIGGIKEIKKIGGFREITETEKGCFTNMTFIKRNINWLDADVTIKRHKWEPRTADIILKIDNNNYQYLFGYLDGEQIRIMSYPPGEDRGCALFKDVFVASGNDGNFFWDVKTGEFDDFTW